jgi:hypothetical protein
MNQRGATGLRVRSLDGNRNLRALVRFAMPDAPPGCVVESATLRLRFGSVTTGRTLEASRLAEGWSESGVTWANQPPTTGTAATTPSGSGTGYREWDVTSQVQTMYDSDALHGFMILDSAENASGAGAEHQFASRESNQPRPQLVIAFAAGGGNVPPADTTAPETTLGSGLPAATTTETSASLSFSSEAGATFECSLNDTAWAACSSPKEYTGLSVGPQSFKVRAKDAAGNVDGSPAAHDWTIEAPASGGCSAAPVTASADADSWIAQGSAGMNQGRATGIRVRSLDGGRNLRALVRFAVPQLPAGCVVESATMRLRFGSATLGRTLEALRIVTNWTELGVTWANQPATSGPAAQTASGTGYRGWDVTSQLQAMYDSGANYGFLIRDAAENAPGAGAEHQFASRESNQPRPELVITFR